jgi:hypothetical protein
MELNIPNCCFVVGIVLRPSLNTTHYDSAYIELLYSYRALAYRLAKLIVITVNYRVENLYGTYSIVVPEENSDSDYIFNSFLQVRNHC